MNQCSSCGGFCGRVCQREFADRALNSAVYWQNRYCELLEIIELFCMDAEDQSDARLQVIDQCEKQVWDSVVFPIPDTGTLVSLAHVIQNIRSLK